MSRVFATPSSLVYGSPLIALTMTGRLYIGKASETVVTCRDAMLRIRILALIYARTGNIE